MRIFFFCSYCLVAVLVLKIFVANLKYSRHFFLWVQNKFFDEYQTRLRIRSDLKSKQSFIPFKSLLSNSLKLFDHLFLIFCRFSFFSFFLLFLPKPWVLRDLGLWLVTSINPMFPGMLWIWLAGGNVREFKPPKGNDSKKSTNEIKW